MTQRFAALAVVVVLALAACGETGDGESDDTTTSTTAATTSETTETTESTESTTTSEPEDGDAQERAESIDISLDELPDGWASAPHQTEEESLVTTCSDFDVDELALARYYTDDFSLGDLAANDGQSVSIGTRVFEDEDTATSILDVLPDDEFIACVNDELESSFGPNSVEGEVVAADVTTSADQTEGFSGELTVTDSETGEPVALWVVFVAIRTGDLVTGLSGYAVGQDIDGPLISGLADRIVELQAA